MVNLDSIVIMARIEALENVFFGYLSANEPPEVATGNKKLFYQFYIDNLERCLKSEPFQSATKQDRYSMAELIKSLKSSLLENF